MRSSWGADSLESERSDSTMIYLDNAATSFPKPEPVYQALDRFARTSLANPGRAGHRMADRRRADARRRAGTRSNQFFRGEAPGALDLHASTAPTA